MKCALCGTNFDLDQAKHGCSGCIMNKGCHKVRCPNCGFETPPEPRWLSKLKQIMNKKGTTK